MSTRRLALTAEQDALIERLVRSGRYRDLGDVVQHGLRLLADAEILDQDEAVEIRTLVEEGRASGLSEEAGEVTLDRLEAKYRAMAKQPR